ncbi:hypothetical protein DPMN_184085 [Dreissena polymorpha]|uniref:Uncharacterized protein n=1 Tax=Dreissena polymorpha TaxID=45954 RepID=A0A9D4DL36_DREPO|nr:hypothetical protein DPMN_184085 [Dreissena polymorpha]
MIRAIFQPVRDINKTNVLTKFHHDKATNVTSRVFPSPPANIRQSNNFFFQNLVNKTNAFNKFHHDWAKNVTSRVHPPGSHETNVLTIFLENWAKNVTSRKNAPPTGGHVFSPIWTIFELVRDINKTNVLTKFHDD